MLFVATFVPSLVIFIVVFLISSRNEQAQRTATGEYVLAWGKGWKAVPVGAAIAWTCIFAVLTIADPPKPDDVPVILGLLLLITVTLVPLSMELFGSRHLVSEKGFSKKTPWSPDFSATWSEVTAVDYSASMMWFEVKTPRGTMRVPQWMDGIQDLSRLVRANVPQPKLTGAAKFLK